MKELKRPHRREDLRRSKPICGQLANNWIKFGQLRREHDLGAGAEHRDRARQRDRLPAHPPQPREHRGPDRRRRDPLQRRHALTASSQPFLARSRQQLAHKQRIAAGQLAARRAERLLGILVQPRRARSLQQPPRSTAQA